MTIVVSNNVTNVQASDSAAARADRLLAETAAATSVSAASGAAIVVPSIDTFNKTYLGSKAADPSVDNTGAALTAGALYFNSSTNRMRSYNGSAWVDYEAAAATAATSAASNAAAASTSASSAASSASAASSSAGSAASSASSAANYQAAAAQLSVGIYPSTSAGLSNGVVATSGLVAGSGGTNGTFNLAFSGGGGAGAAGTFVVSGGAVTSITITNKGYSYTSAPTISFSASSGLAGASATAVLGAIAPVGTFFYTTSSDASQSLLLYRVDAGPVATYITSTPAAALVNAQIGSYTVGLSSAATGTAIANSTVYYWPTSLQTYDQYLTTLKIPVSAAISVTIVVAFVEAGGGLTLVSTTNIPAATVGLNTLSGLKIFVPAGCVVGSTANNGYYDTTSVTMWSTSAVPTTNTSKTVSSATNVHTQFTLAGATFYGATLAPTTDTAVGTIQAMGFKDPIVTTGSALPSNYTYIANNAVASNGYITQFVIGMQSAGSVKVVVANITGNTLTNVTLYSYTLSSGANTVTTNIPVSAGQYVGLCPVGGVFQNNGNTEGVGGWYYVGVPTNGVTLTPASQHRFEWRITVKTGLTGQVQLLQGSAAGTGTGLNLLESADATGVVDATAYFTAARASHPAPYVRPGTFTLTSITNKGEGFWGSNDAAANVDGVRLALPTRPISGGLWYRFRARLMHSIYGTSPLIFIGDSISHWSAATSGDNHYINQIAKWSNLGIAKDEPLMTALRPSSTYTPAFYGVTTSGTVSTGTNGPLTESLILAPGASMSFTGAYEQVDVFYTQSSSAGTLAFAYNGGAAYKTVTCSGASTFDVFSGPSATGQTSSGAYTITNTHGSNSVEITGLVRLGVMSGAVPRLRVMRAAHGSYQFSNFGSTAVTSILKQATYAGGAAVDATVVIELGTNDSLAGLSYATIKSRAETLVGLLTSGGVLARNIFAIPVWRWSYYGATTYESADAALRNAYAGLGVTVVPTDGIDFIAQGLSTDGHPNDAGNALLFNLVAQAISGV